MPMILKFTYIFQCCEGEDSSGGWQSTRGSCVQPKHAVQVECPTNPNLTSASKPVGRNVFSLYSVEDSNLGVLLEAFFLPIFQYTLNRNYIFKTVVFTYISIYIYFLKFVLKLNLFSLRWLLCFNPAQHQQQPQPLPQASPQLGGLYNEPGMQLRYSDIHSAPDNRQNVTMSY